MGFQVLDACALLAFLKETDLWKAGGNLKARGRISLADCFAVALAVREGATILTSDRHEFEPLLATPWFPATVQFIR